jgi:hypothetical protein
MLLVAAAAAAGSVWGLLDYGNASALLSTRVPLLGVGM